MGGDFLLLVSWIAVLGSAVLRYPMARSGSNFR
jgi:hypothetical protein